MIARDAMLAEVFGTLADPGGCVAGVFRRMEECRGLHGAASFRIGVTAAGRCPNHRVEYAEPGGGGSAARVHGAC